MSDPYNNGLTPGDISVILGVATTIIVLLAFILKHSE